MYTPEAKLHRRQIELVHRLIKDVEPLKSWYTQELEQYLLTFENKCEQGLFEELSDVALFQWDGTDQNGIDLWIRFRGSTRAENVHQKLNSALGPWGVGAQTGHYLMLLICFRYNVQSRIRRCSGHNFGHPQLQYIDRIQTRIQNIFDADIFPRHINLEQFHAIPHFTAVGIGPLEYSREYIEEGEPDPRLRGDLRFVALKMKLKCPPLLVDHRNEKQLFNDFLKDNPKPTANSWRELAKLFKEKTDCKQIFPKLPTMLKLYYRQWRDNQLIVLAQQQMNGEYNAVLHQLARHKTAH